MSTTVGPGSSFAGYEVESLLGRGGMGVVYRARDPKLERRVALKLIAPELASDERFRSRFLKEPLLAASLDNPHVIPIYDAGESDGQLYLAMRYVDGPDLGTVLDRHGRMEPERALELLGQVGDALDAAHRRGLVHRDVKPANVLMDEDDHAYLSDFGITKQAGAAATHTGGMMGTLDYMAPEQIRGEAIDGRTDLYALGCMLYECLAGAPPFRRETPAETMWAHLQAEPPRLAHCPAIDGIVRKALAKERGERYANCREMIAAARAALGRGAPSRSIARHLLRRRHAILAAGLLVLAAVVAAATVALTSGGDERAPALVGNGVAVIAQGGAGVSSFVQSAHEPSNIAVGEGAVWVLSSQDRTVARIDPESKAVTGRLPIRGVPTDLAAGGGALWIGRGGGGYSGYITVGISRVDPRTGRVTRTIRLPNRKDSQYSAPFNWGHHNIVVGAGGVWAINPDQTISRIDPATGRLLATIDVQAEGIAAGPEGVWFLHEGAVRRIDPRTNRLGQTIHIGSPAPDAIAVGAGKVWVSAPQEGVVWRVDPGPSPVTSTIRVGEGVTYIAYGARSVWAANYINGTVSRIDPRKSTVATQIPVGGTQALAAGAGDAWISSAGGYESGTLPASACGELESGGGTPDVLVASDLPLQGPGSAGPRAMTDAIRHVLRQHDFRAGRFSVGYRSCDDSTAQTGNFENRRCAANANAYARAHKLVAIIGPYNSDCAQVEIPILNRAPGGPLALIGPTTTYAGLTRPNGMPPPNGYRHEPQVYYPTGVRNFVRLLPGDDQLGGAQAVLAKQLRLHGVYVVDDGSDLTRRLLSEPFRRAARRLRVRVAGSARFDPAARDHGALVERIARSGADGVVLGGDPFHGADRLVTELRARLGRRMPILGHFFFGPVPSVLKMLGRDARGIYVASNDVPRAALPLTPAAKQFVTDLGESAKEMFGVLEAGQAADLVVRAIARSDGTRTSVLRALRASNVKNGLLGSFGFDRNGDNTSAAVPIYRITGTTPPGQGLAGSLRGAVLDRVVEVPASLVQ
jgi:ABC-type branched-subunit amino acid transport system substrate-binding protein/tRNA A-37 threonylcarbamoyl transferase component Bud32